MFALPKSGQGRHGRHPYQVIDIRFVEVHAVGF